MVLVLALLLDAAKPELVTRAFPPISIATGIGCSNVLLTAEIKGPESEAWYCPEVVWGMPDGTKAATESDCPPFPERTDYPRVWRRRICAPPHPNGAEWIVTVSLRKRGKTFAWREVVFHVR